MQNDGVTHETDANRADPPGNFGPKEFALPERGAAVMGGLAALWGLFVFKIAKCGS